MGAAKWIGGFLGFITAGPLGALAGFILGSLFETGLDAVNGPEEYNNREYDDNNGRRQYAEYQRQRSYEGQRNSFLFSMLTLSAYIIRADGKVMHSEMEVVRQFLRQNFGEIAVQQGEDILRRLFDHQKQVGAAQFRSIISSACAQIAQNMDYSQRLQLVNFLVVIAQADGSVHQKEIEAITEVSKYLGITTEDLNAMLNLRDGATNLEAAYKVLGITKDATDEEVKAAYRKMALKHHPDRVATLGDDVKRAAEVKFKEINEAKDLIYKARGL